MHTAHFGTTVGHDRRIAFVQGVWRLADPKIALASFVPFVAGVAIAHVQGATIDPWIAAGAFIAIFFVEVGKNAIHDVIDDRSGAGTAARLLTEGELVAAAWIAFVLAGVLGLAVASVTNPALMILGVAGAAMAAAYSLPPFKLSYRGLGEAAVFLTYGPGIVIGSVLLFGGLVTLDVVTSSVCLGLIIANVLLINEVQDERADRLAGKKTLVVRLGRDRATVVFAIVFAVALALPILGFVAGGSIVLLGLAAAIIPADYAAWSLREHRTGLPLAAQTSALVSYVAAGAGLVAVAWLAQMNP